MTVLLVEDDPVVKLAIRRTLDCLGSRVLDAPDGERALAVAASCQEPIDVLLTDMMMPGMSGRLLAERLTAQRPQTRVIYMSGYTEESIDRRGLGKGPCAFLAKPFSKEELSHVMTEVLLAS
ncbi:MAG: response regulator [Gemmatimonadaceae bacterium]